MGTSRHLQFSMSAASSDVIWQVTRNNNSFLVKRNFLQLSSDPNNLMGKNSFKFSGIANAEAVGIADDTKGVTFTKKNAKRQRQPARNLVEVNLKKDFRKDLSGAALARWCKIWKSQQKAAALSKA